VSLSLPELAFGDKADRCALPVDGEEFVARSPTEARDRVRGLSLICLKARLAIRPQHPEAARGRATAAS
jgi:hypothetical protein